MDPISLEPEFVISNLHMLGFEYSSHFGSNMLKVKYLIDKVNGKSKYKRRIFYVLPVTAQDILSYYEHCSTLGEETDIIKDLPKFKVPSANSSPSASSTKISPFNVTDRGKITRSKSFSQQNEGKRKLMRGCSEGTLKRKENSDEKASNAKIECDKEEKVSKFKKESSRRGKEEENVENRGILMEKRKNMENKEGQTEKRKNEDKHVQDRKESLWGSRRVRVEDEKEIMENQPEKRKKLKSPELKADFTLISDSTIHEPPVQARVTKV